MSIKNSNEDLDEYIKAKLEETARQLGYEDYCVKIDDVRGTMVGNLGVIKNFYIDGKLDGKRKTTYLIAKTITASKVKRRCIPVEVYAARETHIYNSVFKVFDQMQDEYNVPAKFPHIKVYSASTEKFKELILMENLAIEGYTFPKNYKALDFEHTVLYLQALGQFHALSFAFKNRNPEVFGELVKDIYELQMSTSVLCYIERMFKNAYRYGVDNVPEVKDYLHDLGNEGTFRALETLFAEPSEHAIICHGDCWSGNSLYLYKDKKPEKFMLLDWQCIRHISPVVDLLYLLFTSVEEELRENRLKELIEIYYQALKTNLLDLKCDVRE